ncbi:SRPBCC family protein [Lacisediminimonas profundi]|uniref:SRPBCC family protein n=1 Tax=Lacisediminimonas profundi TaxID=2603856 RepID=UPI00124B194E|nr:SRPBCC family protein [Lacisediminimonas profundi]
MQVEQSFQVPFPRALVWRSFRNAEGIVACLPGASLSAPPVDGMLKLAMTVKLGPIVAAFAGDAMMTLDDSGFQGSVAGGGSDRKSGSRVKGEAAFSLHEQAGPSPSTRVDVSVDFTIAGSLAQFSRGGIVQELAARMTEAFAENLRQTLEAESVQAGAAVIPIPEPSITSAGSVPPSAEVSKPSPAASPNAPLDLGRLFWPMLVARVKGFFRPDKKV